MQTQTAVSGGRKKQFGSPNLGKQATLMAKSGRNAGFITLLISKEVNFLYYYPLCFPRFP